MNLPLLVHVFCHQMALDSNALPHPIVGPDVGCDEVNGGHHVIGQEVLSLLGSPWG